EHFDALQSEFRSEVELLSKIDHRNLVKLLGYVDKGNERLIITEYVPNGTLRAHLDGVHGNLLDFSQRLEICIDIAHGVHGNLLDFSQRLEICIDIAHGLTYLHLYAEKQIIHRDVKSSNILLTERLRAKVADFGFARLGDAETGTTHVVTKVRGTVGYLDPEYMRTYQLTPKSDVYSFGVLLIEILTGRRPIESKRSPEEKVTIRWAFGKYNDGDLMDLVDPQMKEAVDGEIFAKMLGLAFQCAAPTRADRPEMKVVGEQLWVIRMDYLRHGRRGEQRQTYSSQRHRQESRILLEDNTRQLGWISADPIISGAIPPIPPPFGASSGNLSSPNANRVDTMPITTDPINTTTTTNVAQSVFDENIPQLLDSRGGSQVTNVPAFERGFHELKS
nr:calmodulin-binding receptor-like cytoplasmic kinase 3 [Tanacetum cinerariifolium]